MNAPTFPGAGIAAGIGLALLLRAIGHYVNAPVNRLHRRWLERRLRFRLARGTDRYFEELRSIETSIALTEKAPRPTNMIDRVVQIASIPFLAILLLSWFLPEGQLPDWTRLMIPCIFILVGVQTAWGANDPPGRPRWGFVILGLAMIALFSVDIILELIRYT